MAEDAMVQLLMDISSCTVEDEHDIVLARAAGRWAHAVAGWRPYQHSGFVFEKSGLHFWVLGANLKLQVRVSPDNKRSWHTHLECRIDHVGHALNVLGAEELLPARFSPMGRRALEDYATCLDRSAAVMRKVADDPDCAPTVEPWELRIKAEALEAAGDQARAFPGAELAVMS